MIDLNQRFHGLVGSKVFHKVVVGTLAHMVVEDRLVHMVVGTLVLVVDRVGMVVGMVPQLVLDH